MRGTLTALLLAGLAVPATPALAQLPPLPPAALELAHALMSRDESLYGDGDQGRIRLQIQEALLASPGGCNPNLSECQAAAAAVAREVAPSYREADRARSERITAWLLADMLRPDEMARFAQYLRGEEGGRLLAALAMLRQPDQTRRRRREIESTLDRVTATAMAEARALFRQRIRNLPGAAPR